MSGQGGQRWLSKGRRSHQSIGSSSLPSIRGDRPVSIMILFFLLRSTKAGKKIPSFEGLRSTLTATATSSPTPSYSSLPTYLSLSLYFSLHEGIAPKAFASLQWPPTFPLLPSPVFSSLFFSLIGVPFLTSELYRSTTSTIWHMLQWPVQDGSTNTDTKSCVVMKQSTSLHIKQCQDWVINEHFEPSTKVIKTPKPFQVVFH